MKNQKKKKNRQFKSKAEQSYDKKMLKIDKIEWKIDEDYINRLKRATTSYLQRTSKSDKRKIFDGVNSSWVDDELLEQFKHNEFEMPKWDT